MNRVIIAGIRVAVSVKRDEIKNLRYRQTIVWGNLVEMRWVSVASWRLEYRKNFFSSQIRWPAEVLVQNWLCRKNEANLLSIRSL